MTDKLALFLLLTAGALLAVAAFYPVATNPNHDRIERPTIKQPDYDPAHIALANAARKHGVDPLLLLAISRFETAKTFSPLIGPGSSSAKGLCQMIRATRKRYDVKLSKYDRSKPYISHLIDEAEHQADACARFTRDQIGLIRGIVNRKPTPGEIYLCHLLGMGSCERVIKAPSGRPVSKVTSSAARKVNGFIRRAKTAGGLRIAASKMIRKQMQLVDVPPENACTF